MKNIMKYKYFEHTADIQFEAYGKTLEEAFTNSANAMIHFICEDKIHSKIKKRIKVQGRDLENLLYNFLEEFLVLFDSEYFLYGNVEKINILMKKNNHWELDCIVAGDLAKNYKFFSSIKAVTYNEMIVKKNKDKWICYVTVDI